MASTSFFTKQLVQRLEADGASMPDSVIALLDKPFGQFCEEEEKLYESQFKSNHLETAFSRLLKTIYDEAADSARHSWKAMFHILKDTPIKRCLAFLSDGQEGGDGAGKPEVRPPRQETEAPAPVGDGGVQGSGSVRKSFFTKKMEYMLEDRQVKMPASIIRLLDLPFEEFTPEDTELYEREFKGRHLTLIFGDLLQELYERMGHNRYGWESACRYLKDTPMKVCAMYILKEEERLEKVEEPPDYSELDGVKTVREKYNVKPYRT